MRHVGLAPLSRGNLRGELGRSSMMAFAVIADGRVPTIADDQESDAITAWSATAVYPEIFDVSRLCTVSNGCTKSPQLAQEVSLGRKPSVLLTELTDCFQCPPFGVYRVLDPAGDARPFICAVLNW